MDSISNDGLTTTQGDEFTFTVTGGNGNDNGGGGGGGTCFIATASYEAGRQAAVAEGAPVEGVGGVRITADRLRKLNHIRGLRDAVLLRLSAGRSFSAWYYAVGPYAADAVRDKEPLKAALRKMLLDPLSALSRSCTEARE